MCNLNITVANVPSFSETPRRPRPRCSPTSCPDISREHVRDRRTGSVRKSGFRFWFLYYAASWSSGFVELCVSTCTTRHLAANYTALISALPSAETNFHTAISTIISYIQTRRRTQQHKGTKTHTHRQKKKTSKLFPV